MRGPQVTQAVLGTVVLSLWHLPFGCSDTRAGEGSSHRDGDAPPATTDAGTATANAVGTRTDAGYARVAACFDPANLEPCSAFSRASPSSRPNHGVVVASDALGADASFVAIGGLAVLARQGTGSAVAWSVELLHLQLGSDGLEISTTTLTVPPAVGATEVRAVWGIGAPDAVFEVDAVALACGENGCQILGADSSRETTLRFMLDVEVDAARPSMVGVHVGDGRMCVHGDGVQCHDGARWEHVLSPSEAPDVVDVSWQDPVAAVTKTGLLLVQSRSGFESVTVPNAVSGIEPTRVTSRGGHLSVLLSDGAWLFGDSNMLEACSLTSPLVLGTEMEDGAAGVSRVAVSSSGAVARYLWDTRAQARAWCLDGQLELMSPVVGFSRTHCNSSTNLLLLTETRLLSLLTESPTCVRTGS